ncbi:unnamed protein product, partial [Iphiclides podalirius]
MKKCTVIIISTVAALLIAAGLAVLIWWLVQSEDLIEIIQLEGDGFEGIRHSAAFTRIPSFGDMFWLFYPTVASSPTSRPIILWLDGITGVPPSLLANFGMFGPLDFNLNRREGSWIEDYNLLFMDAPIGTGFSRAENTKRISSNIDDHVDSLLHAVESFYYLHEEYSETPLYIFGQGHGSQLATLLAIRLTETERFTNNVKGVAIGNGIVAPAVALNQLGFYLEELGYIDRNGRNAIEELSATVNNYTNHEQYEEAFDLFVTLGEFINENAGAIAVNLNHIVEKLTRGSTNDYFGTSQYVRDISKTDVDLNKFMDETVAPLLGIPDNVNYDGQREAATNAFRSAFMKPTVERVEYILQNSNVTVIIYNGNLDAVSNTPGQLQWVENLQWPGQDSFLNSPRSTLIVNSLVEGYFRQTARLQFYWMNAAGQSIPLDSPTAMSRVLQRITTI